jgi:hypothetical protein
MPSSPESDIYVDGGGVLKDQPLTPGSHILFVLDPRDRSKDVVAYVHDGMLHVHGCYLKIAVEQVAVNAVDLRTVRPTD